VFLISEAVRGEGALLYNVRGERFLPHVDERAELAPRDVVARAIHREMRATEADHVLLDITGRDASWLAARFPQIYRTCLAAGLDMATERIPVSPAAHYTMGGVRTSSWGEATLPGLYAVGEVACTAVHGANRLASNSLLETVVFAHRAVEAMWALPGTHEPPVPTPEARSLAAPAGADGVPGVDELRELMWSHVGIERDGAGLAEAARTLARWHAALDTADGSSAPDRAAPDRGAYELRSLVLCGRLAAEAALAREESRGAHYRADFPEPREEWRRHLVFRADASAAGLPVDATPDARGLR
jgi:L-aspartate oxidase